MIGSRLRGLLLQTAGTRALSTVGRALCFLIVVRTLAPAEYGLYALAQTAVLVGAVLGTLNLQAFLVRTLPGRTASEQQAVVSVLVRLVIPINTAMGIAAAIVCWWTVPAFAVPGSISVAFVFAFETTVLCVEGYLLGSQQISTVNRLVAVRTASQALPLLTLFATGAATLPRVLAIWAVSDLIGLVTIRSAIRGVFSGGVAPRAADVWSDALRYSLPLLAASIAFYLMKSVDRYLLAGLIGLPSVARYDVAYKLVNSFYGVTVLAVNTVMVPRVMAAENRGDDSDRDRQIGTTARISAAALVCCVIGALVMPARLWTLIAGNSTYAALGGVAAALAAGMLLNIAGTPAHLLLLAKKRTRSVAVADVSGLALNVILNVGLIARFGAYGAAASLAAGFGLASAIKYVHVRRSALLTPGLTRWASEPLR